MNITESREMKRGFGTKTDAVISATKEMYREMRAVANKHKREDEEVWSKWEEKIEKIKNSKV